MDMYDQIPVIGLDKIYNDIKIGSIIEIKSKRSKKADDEGWISAIVKHKEINKVYDTDVHIIEISAEKGYYSPLRDIDDFEWRYDELFDCNKYLLHGYWNKTLYIRKGNPFNIKRINDYLIAETEEEAVLKALLKYQIINKKDVDDNKIKIIFEQKKNRKNKDIRVFNNDKLIYKFTQEASGVKNMAKLDYLQYKTEEYWEDVDSRFDLSTKDIDLSKIKLWYIRLKKQYIPKITNI